MHSFTTKSIKDIEHTGGNILRQNPASPVRFRILRDIFKLPAEDLLLKKAQTDMLRCRWVKALESDQNGDGSWGTPEAGPAETKASFSATEKAIHRCLILGLDKNSLVLSKAAAYLAAVLQGDVQWAGIPIDDINCNVEMKMMAASILSEVDPWNKALDDLWDIWYALVKRVFSSGKYDPAEEKPATGELLGINTHTSHLALNTSYILTFLASRSCVLPQMLEELLLNRIWQSDLCKGHSAIKLHTPPHEADKIELETWFHYLEILSSFRLGMVFAEEAVYWLWSKTDRDGLWDLLNNPVWMLSDTWQDDLNRKIDTTVRILILLRKNWYI